MLLSPGHDLAIQMGNSAMPDTAQPNEFGVEKGPKSPPVFAVGNIGDLADMENYRHGHPAELYARLRREAPVYWNDEIWDWEPGFWAMTRYDDVVAVSKNPTVFSSEVGGHQITYGDPRRIDPKFTAAVLGNMIAMDPPLHQTYRKMAAPAFTPKALKKLDANLRRRIDGIVDAIAPKGEAEFVTQVSELVPIYTLADLLGVPEADRPKLIDWTNKLIAAYDPTSPYLEGTDPETLTNETGMALFQYGAWLFAQRKAEPRDDLMSVMAHAEPDGDPIPLQYLNGFFLLMVIAGNETTRNTIAGMQLLLSRNPGERAKLLCDRALLPNAVQEALRLVAPVIHFRRTATTDTEIRGQKIAAGEKVVMWYGAANRDEDVFDDPERFDIARPNADKHLAFGIGEHFCLGSRLGLMQIEAVYQALLARLPDMEVAGEPEYVGSNFISGIRRLPVRFTPA